ncbi:hypothetical protein FHS16_001250 [Paenibacillus endophyticus]|uniref:Uncharacterized protein n=1 Tax=Paenibacillus endophyticus TaxID=1294268 RepID=A0A7W5C5C8_9BACL|nr:hypothetical protein [Paenibacillus endophyticus]MBB3151207.1 hypothetical protein [Paenibacillus endophyticus]
MSAFRFEWNERLRIRLPVLEMEWEQYEVSEQRVIISQWELIRGTIPDRVMEFEHHINRKQLELFDEESFERSCILNYEIADYASRINDLHIWYRIDQQLESRRHS